MQIIDGIGRRNRQDPTYDGEAERCVNVTTDGDGDEEGGDRRRPAEEQASNCRSRFSFVML
jgi:hypothetical protein